MGNSQNRIKQSLWELLNENRHLKDLPIEVKHIISINVSQNFKNYRKEQRNKLLKSIKKVLGND